jgi:hypothetical protein
MNWLLYHRLHDGSWAPAHGPLSTFAHGAIVWAFLLFVSAYAVWRSVPEMRRGKRRYWMLLAWGVGVWPVWLLAAIPHMVPPFTREYYIVWAATALLPGLGWLAFGLLWVMPMMERDRRDTRVGGRSGRAGRGG